MLQKPLVGWEPVLLRREKQAEALFLVTPTTYFVIWPAGAFLVMQQLTNLLTQGLEGTLQGFDMYCIW